MLDVKKWMAKVSDYINLNKKRTLAFTATTNTQGAALIPNFNRNYSVVNASVTNSVNCLCIPFIYDNRTWYIKAVDWQNLNTIGNTSLNFVVEYKVGGVLLNSIFKAFSDFRSLLKMGGGVDAGCKETVDENLAKAFEHRNCVRGIVDVLKFIIDKYALHKLGGFASGDVHNDYTNPDSKYNCADAFGCWSDRWPSILQSWVTGMCHTYRTHYNGAERMGAVKLKLSRELLIPRARFVKGNTHRITISERRWAVC